MCTGWTEGRMKAYLKHQSSLERKRQSKKKIKESNAQVDLAVLCTGVQDADTVRSDDGLSRGYGGDCFLCSN